MKIKALAPWFGGKRNLAPRIAAELGQHRAYFELGCGSMAVLLSKQPCMMETAVDLHGDLCNLAEVVRHPTQGARLYRRLRRTLMCDAVFQQAKDSEPEDPVGRAYRYFVLSWLGRGGNAGCRQYDQHFAVRYTPNGGHGATRWRHAVDSIPSWRRRLANVTILRRDLFEVLPKIDDISGVAVYVDPPYLVKGTLYEHDFGPEDHTRLAEALGRFRRARVVVSYYQHVWLDELYPGWTQVRIPVVKSVAHQGRRGEMKARATEVLLINGPSRETGLFTPQSGSNLDVYA